MNCGILRWWQIASLTMTLSLGVCTSTHSQTLPVRYYTIKDGLLSNQVNSIFQDSRGLIWMGTSNGISVFNGISFTNYTTVNGLVNNNVSDIVESRNPSGAMYAAGSTGGVCKLENGTFREIKVGKPVPSANVQGLTVDDSGQVWCITKEGIFIVRDSIASLVETRPAYGNFTNILLMYNKSAWLASDSDLSMYPNAQANSFSRRQLQHFPSLIMTLVHDRDSSIWVGTADSMLYEFHNFEIVHKRRLTELAPGFIADDGHGALWLFWTNNIMRLSKQEIEKAPAMLYPKESDLADARTKFAFFDRENNLWVATWSKGVMILPSRNQLHVFTPIANGMASADTNGHIWVASEGGAWEIFPQGNGLWNKHLHRFLRSGADQSLYFLYIDPVNNLWVNANAEPGAVTCYSIKNRPGQESGITMIRAVIPDSSSDKPHLHSMLIDRQQRLWCSVYPTGVVVRELQTLRKIRTFTLEDGLPDNAVRVIYQDKDGNVWLGGFYGGLAVANGHDSMDKKLHKFTVSEGLPDNGIRSFHEDNKGRLWVGTRYGGAAIVQNDHFQTVSMREGLQSNAVWSIANDDRNRLWFGTDVGLECVSELTGMPVRNKNNFIGSRVLSCGVYRNTFLWFVTIDGVTINDYRSDVPDTTPPPIIITRFQVNGNDMQLNQAYALSYQQNLCTIEFAGLSYGDPQAMRYQYKLEDVDQDWLQPTSHHFVTYATLQPGQYVFHVRAINGDGVISRSPASLEFKILPPFWRRWWFYCLVGCFIGGVLVAIYRYRINKLKELERLRVRIASDLHDDVGSSLTRIAVHSEVIQTTTSPEKVLSSSQEIGTMSREIISTLSDVVWSIDARHDSLGDLVDRLRAFALDVFSTKDILLTCETVGHNFTEKIPADVRQNVYLIVKEAIHNAAKYSCATEVKIRFERQADILTIVVSDNGRGLPAEPKSAGHGLSNMKMRAERIGATISFGNSHGLTITCVVRI